MGYIRLEIRCFFTLAVQKHVDWWIGYAKFPPDGVGGGGTSLLSLGATFKTTRSGPLCYVSFT